MHVVQIKIDWTGSPPVSIQLGNNDVAYLRCRPTPRPFRPLAGSHREGWISLEVVTARRPLTLSLGVRKLSGVLSSIPAKPERADE